MKESRQLIRPYEERDEAEVVDVWYRAGRAVYTFLPDWQSLTPEQATEIFRDVIRPQHHIWVGLRDEHVVAFLAMANSYIDRMYVGPAEWRKGWGTALIRFAKTMFPDGLELCTHQQNCGARILYEKHRFRAVRFGLSPPPESVPDVEYHWRPEYDSGCVGDQSVNG